MKATEILLAVLLPQQQRAAPVPEAPRLVAGEALAEQAAKLTDDERAAAVTVIAQIARDSTLPAHRVRAATALLRMGVNEIPDARPEGAP